MRVLLVRASPPGLGREGIVPPGLAPPLALLHLSSSLRHARPGTQVRIVDAAIELADAGGIAAHVLDFEPDLVGLSALSLEAFHVRDLAAAVRRARPEVPVVVGGPIASAHPRGVLEHVPELDASAFGEGERTVIEIADRVRAGGDLSGVPGVVARSPDGTLSEGPPRPVVPDLSTLPPPEWDEVDLAPYNRVLNWAHVPLDPGGCAYIDTTRGCPFECTFCHKFFGRKVRAIPPIAVVDEMERIQREYGVRDFHIVDDIFNYRPGRVMTFCKEILRRGLDVRFAFPNGLRGDRLEPDDVRALADAGVYYIALSVETLSPRLQRMIRKRLDVERVLRTATRIASLGVLTRGFVMMGFPTETREEMELTARDMIDSDFHLAHFFTVTPYPGTALFETACAHGFDPSIWVEDAFTYDRDFINTSAVADDVFIELVRRTRRDFYEHPPRIRSLRRWLDRNGLADHPYMHSSPPWTIVLERTRADGGMGGGGP